MVTAETAAENRTTAPRIVFWRIVLLIWWLLPFAAAGANLVSAPAFGVRIAPGFRISLYAGPDLANDIYAMTLDAAGKIGKWLY